MSSSRATIAATIQPGKTPSSISTTSTASTSTLSAIGSSSEPSEEVVPRRRAIRPSNQSVAIATQKSAVAQYSLCGKLPREQEHDERDGERAGDGQLIGEAHRLGENTPPMALFSKVLVANRGEIAIRIFRTLRELGIGSVAVYSEADRDALHAARRRRGVPARPRPGRRELSRRRADPRGGRRAPAPRRSIPGYGFLAENAAFARAVEDAGLDVDRPAARGDRADGLEDERAHAMQAAGVPIIPGTTEPVESADEVLRLGEEIGYPLLVKAAAGGGGKGMKVVAAPRRGRAGVRVGAARGREVLRRRPRSTSSATSRIRATSRCRCSPTRTAT